VKINTAVAVVDIDFGKSSFHAAPVSLFYGTMMLPYLYQQRPRLRTQRAPAAAQGPGALGH
jgi:hypothetical protein